MGTSSWCRLKHKAVKMNKSVDTEIKFNICFMVAGESMKHKLQVPEVMLVNVWGQRLILSREEVLQNKFSQQGLIKSTFLEWNTFELWRNRNFVLQKSFYFCPMGVTVCTTTWTQECHCFNPGTAACDNIPKVLSVCFALVTKMWRYKILFTSWIFVWWTVFRI